MRTYVNYTIVKNQCLLNCKSSASRYSIIWYICIPSIVFLFVLSIPLFVFCTCKQFKSEKIKVFMTWNNKNFFHFHSFCSIRNAECEQIVSFNLFQNDSVSSFCIEINWKSLINFYLKKFSWKLKISQAITKVSRQIFADGRNCSKIGAWRQAN